MPQFGFVALAQSLSDAKRRRFEEVPDLGLVAGLDQTARQFSCVARVSCTHRRRHDENAERPGTATSHPAL